MPNSFPEVASEVEDNGMTQSFNEEFSARGFMKSVESEDEHAAAAEPPEKYLTPLNTAAMIGAGILAAQEIGKAFKTPAYKMRVNQPSSGGFKSLAGPSKNYEAEEDCPCPEEEMNMHKVDTPTFHGQMGLPGGDDGEDFKKFTESKHKRDESGKFDETGGGGGGGGGSPEAGGGGDKSEEVAALKEDMRMADEEQHYYEDNSEEDPTGELAADAKRAYDEAKKDHDYLVGGDEGGGGGGGSPEAGGGGDRPHMKTGDAPSADLMNTKIGDLSDKQRTSLANSITAQLKSSGLTEEVIAEAVGKMSGAGGVKSQTTQGKGTSESDARAMMRESKAGGSVLEQIFGDIFSSDTGVSSSPHVARGTFDYDSKSAERARNRLMDHMEAQQEWDRMQAAGEGPGLQGRMNFGSRPEIDRAERKSLEMVAFGHTVRYSKSASVELPQPASWHGQLGLPQTEQYKLWSEHKVSRDTDGRFRKKNVSGGPTAKKAKKGKKGKKGAAVGVAKGADEPSTTEQIVLAALQEGPLTLAELAEATKISQVNNSPLVMALASLRDAGKVKAKKVDGKDTFELTKK